MFSQLGADAVGGVTGAAEVVKGDASTPTAMIINRLRRMSLLPDAQEYFYRALMAPVYITTREAIRSFEAFGDDAGTLTQVFKPQWQPSN
jgi:hypothetical protein